MSQSVIDDREYRRGMVLGLTMAEVLILLFFLLLLALGGRLLQQERTLKEKDRLLSDQTTTLIRQAAIIASDPKLARSAEGREATIRVDELRSENESLKSQLSDFRAAGVDPAQAGELLQSLKMARAFDPDAPPALLQKEAMEFFVTLHGSEKGSLPLIEEHLSDAATAKQLEGALEAAVKVDPQKPVETLAAAAQLSAELEAKLEGTELAGKSAAEIMQMLSRQTGEGENLWPPIIQLSESNGFNFASGKAEVGGEFEGLLSGKVVDQIIRHKNEYGVDVLEVVGHTDEQRVSQKLSNLDDMLVLAWSDEQAAQGLEPGDNVGLGMARALAVAKILQNDKRLDGLRIIPLSGGQLIDTDYKVASGRKGNVQERRRIELRLRRSDEFAAKP